MSYECYNRSIRLLSKMPEQATAALSALQVAGYTTLVKHKEEGGVAESCSIGMILDEALKREET